MPGSRIPLWVALVACQLLASSRTRGEEPLDYNRHVRPILAANCFACHGPDDESRQADLRLDTSAGAQGVIAPGDAASSELVRRISSDNDDERMPPQSTGKSLTPDQIELLRRWIDSGAKYAEHWSFAPPQKPAPPTVRDKSWPRSAIDSFVLARLEAEGLKSSPEADRYTLVRRLYLDLLGLPPTPEDADAFIDDKSPQAYVKLVDRLLASKHYGERWARVWLDLARYADTNGYEKDRPRSIWPYRDWVIHALNADMPFDQFTIEQLAGDMLPAATSQQKVASGFNRNTMLNEEGGIDPLEYRFYAMVDRVATTGTVWLGLTLGCAQCHTHKYDPITHTDYYRFLALLNNADEPDLIVPDETIEGRRDELNRQIAALEEALPEQFPPREGESATKENQQAHLEERFAEWLRNERPEAVAWQVLRPVEMQSSLPKLETLADGSVFSSGDITKRDVFKLRFVAPPDKAITALRLEVLPDERLPASGPGRAYYEGRQGDFFLSEVTANSGEMPIKFAGASHSYGKISVGSGKADAANVIDGEGSTGWSTSGGEGKPHRLVLNLAEPLAAGSEFQLTMLFERHFAVSLGRFRWSATSSQQTPRAKTMPVEVESLLSADERNLTDADAVKLQNYFLSVAPELAEARKQIDKLRSQLPGFPHTLVLQERPADNPRATFRHHRGEYLQPREAVEPGLPEVLVRSGTQPQNRLELAQWLVSRDNPLTARVVANRAWKAFFGQSLVTTSGDFGTQAPPPSHPELLDWLACQLMDDGWSLKQLHRRIVTSATYRQSSYVTKELARRDSDNRLLARASRFRLDAEIIRDIGLAASGLFSDKVGGPSVYPPQPASVTEFAYGETPWKPSTGEDRYRRSLYTFSKRTAPFAAYTVFDAPTGENCTPERERSNTPLQALTLLNDEMFLEFARGLAKLAMADESASPEERARSIFRRLLTREPTAKELAAIVAYEQAQHNRLECGELTAKLIVGHDAATADEAAWTLVARALMNLDETNTRQ